MINKNSMLDTDPFEEFEFKPINEGLGFHRKPNSNSSVTAAPSANSNVSTPKFMPPLPRPEMRSEIKKENLNTRFQIPTIEDDSIAVAQTAVNEILKNLNQKRQLDFIHETEKQKLALKKSKPFLMAATLDGMLILATFLLSMIIMLTVTKTDLFLNLTHAESSKMIYVSTLSLFISITFIYMVLNRAFLGFTPGEWAFDQRCGQENQMKDLSYIPRLALRTLMVILTGFVITPLLSYLLNKDIAGDLCGVTLFRSPNAT